MKELPPCAAYLTYSHIHQALKLVFNRRDCCRDFSELLSTYLNVRNVVTLSSGRAAISLLLRILAQNNQKNEVVVPAYACYTIPSAVVKAGLTNVPVDVNPATLDFDMRCLENSIGDNTLAVIAVHPYGIPCDIKRISELCRQKGVFLIEDAAQALGGTCDGRMLGSFGDAAILSFGRGKPVTCIHGGAISTDNDELARELKNHLSRRSDSFGNRYLEAINAAAYPFSISKRGFPIIRRLPFLGVGTTRFSTDFEIKPLTDWKAALGTVCMKYLDAHNHLRRMNAAYYSFVLYGMQGLKTINSPQESKGIFLKYPLVFDSDETARFVLGELKRSGLGASRSWPDSIDNLPQANITSLQQTLCMAARDMPGRLITLPTHFGMSSYDREKIVNCIRDTLYNASQTRIQPEWRTG